MAEKRMFTKHVIDSDAFLDMPLSTQALYFHLCMRADDDGFINNPKKLQRYIGAGDDDLRLLLAKRFVIGFESGVIVIKHWRMHNTLRRDRYNPTQYQEEFAQLTLKDNHAYSERGQEAIDSVAKRLPNGCHSVVEYSIDKCREEKESVGEGNDTAVVCTSCGKDVDIPSLDDVAKHVSEKGYIVNPMRFYTYYANRDWKSVSGYPVDWRMKLKEWDFDERQKASAPGTTSSPSTQSDSGSTNPFLEIAKKEGLL